MEAKKGWWEGWKGWPRQDKVTLGLMLATVAAVLVSAGNQFFADRNAARLEKQSERLQSAGVRSLAQRTALVYLDRVSLERKGLVVMVQRAAAYQSYLLPADFDASATDDAALLAAPNPPKGTVDHLDEFEGQVILIYDTVLARTQLHAKLNARVLGQVCAAIHFSNVLEPDLTQIVYGRQQASTPPVPHCGPRGYIRPT